MTLWLVFALMTAAAIFVVLWPLGRRAGARPGGSDLAVYRDQLDEIARDRAGGLIGEAEAEAARVEVSRRLLAAADAAAEHAPAPGGTVRRRAAAVMAFIVVPAVGVAFYASFGAPHLPDMPRAARQAPALANQSIDGLVAQVEAHLARKPEDGRGWEVLAPVYLRLGRLEEAVKARQNALRLLGSTPDREASLGEAITAAQNGVVTEQARAAFARALAREPKHDVARYYMGLAAEQEGKREEAARIWRGLVAEAQANSPWALFLRQALARVDPSGAAAMSEPSGPSAEDVAAAALLKPEDRDAMVRGMVERLAERLKNDGSDVDGWVRLVRAHLVLGEREKAQAAAGAARRALEGDAEKVRRLDEAVKGLGLEG
ncbi:MAG: cytochrome c-type biogenesis protein CycH [Alphaproteobacteria bacterium]|nr:MAG: cytochrome c-type biogenesis protein CycH [Alphaproteobacteria bacterium]